MPRHRILGIRSAPMPAWATSGIGAYQKNF